MGGCCGHRQAERMELGVVRGEELWIRNAESKSHVCLMANCLGKKYCGYRDVTLCWGYAEAMSYLYNRKSKNRH